MGRFWTTGTSLSLLLLAACGDNVGDAGVDIPDNHVVLDDGVQGRVIPEVCGVMAWDPAVNLDPALDVSIAAREAGGATVVAAPLGGGILTGFQLDPRMNMEGGTISKLPIKDALFDHVTVSYIQQRPVTVALADGAAYLHMYDQALQNPEYIAKVEATAVADPTFFKAAGNLVMPAATNEGLMMYHFQDSLEPIDSKLFYATKPIQSLTAAQLGTYMMIAWSTETECYLSWNTTYEPGVVAKVDRACPSPRLSMNEATGDAVLVFESRDGVRMMPIHLTMFAGDAPVLRADASSPRTLFDGKRFWLSYIDARGDVVVGFLDENQRPVTVSLGAPRPERAGYELIMLDNSPTIFSVDGGGYTAYRMCMSKTIE